jgi:hypothetical protein
MVDIYVLYDKVDGALASQGAAFTFICDILPFRALSRRHVLYIVQLNTVV